MTEHGPYISAFDGAPSFVVPVRDPETLRVVRVDCWAVEPSGFFEWDEEVGRRHADAALAYAKRKGQPSFLTYVLGSIIHKSARQGWGGMEFGFCERIASLAYQGAHH